MREEAVAADTAETADGPLAAYRRRRAEGHLEADTAQLLGAEKLQALHNRLARQALNRRGGWRERLGLGQRAGDADAQGLYIFGAVGRGKSMLMDMFFAAAPLEKKRRVHFHAFMLEVHESLHRWRKGTSGDPIPPLAAAIAKACRLICFDEFQVTNIADAMLLGRLFGALLDAGVTVVATSNVAPDDLYAGGLQRDRFLPFIALLKGRLDILELDGEIDYRRLRIRDLAVYHSPLGFAASQALAAAFARLTDGAKASATSLGVMGREVSVPRAAKGVAWFSFEELCRRPLAAPDYLAIATHFHTMLLDGVPAMTREERNEARRFTILIDALYEHRVHLIVAAENLPDRLYPAGEGAEDFRRTASRLVEMQTRDFLALRHLT